MDPAIAHFQKPGLLQVPIGKVLPMTPGKQSMQFDPLDPKDDDDDAKPPPTPKPRPKKEKT